MDKIVLYGFDKENSLKIYAVSKEFELSAIFADDSFLNMTMKEILALDENAESFLNLDRHDKNKHLKKNFSENIDFIFFSNMERSKLYGFLKVLKDMGITTPHKSVLTPTNSAWTLMYLMDHIKEEHRTILKWNSLGEYVKKLRNTEFVEKEKNEIKNELLKMAEALKTETDLTEKKVDEVLQKIKEFMD